MPPSPKKMLDDFIDGIPDDKLQEFPDTPRLIYQEQNFRLDLQGKTTAGEWNLQIQVNRAAATKALRKLAPLTIAGPVLVSSDANMTPEEIRQEFRNKIIQFHTVKL